MELFSGCCSFEFLYQAIVSDGHGHFADDTEGEEFQNGRRQ